MQRNLAALRQLAYDRVDWAPNASPDQKARVNRAINRAMLQLSQDCPGAFHQETGYFTTQPDVIPTLLTDTMSVLGTDAWVLETDLTVGTTNAVVWATDGTWDGRMIQLTTTDNTIYQKRIRDVWQSGNKIRISLYEPWGNTTDTGMAFRVYTEAYYLPDDVMTVNSIQLMLGGRTQPLYIEGQDSAEQLYYNDLPAQQQRGLPTIAYRRDPFSLPAPTMAPVVSIDTNPWSGPEPLGTFEYCYTYCWGVRNQQWGSPNPSQQTSGSFSITRYEPLWESPPSPVSVAITPEVTDRVLIKLPDIDFMQGFGDNSMPRYQHTGWYIRLYRKRAAATTTGAGNYIEGSGAFFYLSAVGSSFTDAGTITPDYSRRLRPVHTYQSLMMYPRPDQAYNVSVRYTRRPVELTNDYDAPLAPPDATDAILHLTVAYLYETMGNMQWSQKAMQDYLEQLMTLQKRYGDLRPSAIPIRRDLARPRVGRRLRKWYP